MPGPLAGLRVIDCTTGTAGTRVGGGLADYGADVIWVERPGGDPLRDGLAVEYSVYNRGKRGVELDLTTDEGRAALDGLLRAADVMISSWRPGVADNLGIGYAQLHERHPHLVVCEVSGFGADGPYRDIPGLESLVFGVVGVTAEQVGVREAPIYVGLPFASLGAAYMAQIGILAALHRRVTDGHGRHVETSLVDGTLAYLGMVWSDSDDPSAAPRLNPGGRRLVSRTFLCADDEYLGVHTGAVGAFDRFIEVVGLRDEIPMPESGSSMALALTADQVVTMRDRIPEIFLTRTREEWLRVLLDADVCAIPVLRPGEAFDEPQARHNNMVVRVDDPVLGAVEQVAPPAKFSAMPPAAPQRAPRAGEHTQAVLAEYRNLPAQTAPAGPSDTRPLLDGFHIVDFGAYYAGPYSSRLLADLGADVVKVETLAGDQLRGLARCFRSAQAGKRAISVDLKDAELRDAVGALIAQADAVTHNMRPGAAERLGIGYRDVCDRNPAVIYLDSPPWGVSGPRMAMQSFAPLVSGIVGASYEVAGQFNEPLFPAGNEDPGSGLLGAFAILAALYARDRGAGGTFIENSQFNATFAHVAHIVRRCADGTVVNSDRLDPLQFGVSATDRIYTAADGWISFAASGRAVVPALERLLGRGSTSEPSFATLGARQEHDLELTSELTEVFGRHDLEWIKDRLAGTGAGAVRPVSENNCAAYHREPENQRSGRIASVADPALGVIREIAQLVRVGDAAVVPHVLAPGLGQHTDEVLSGIGYQAADIDKWRARGAIR